MSPLYLRYIKCTIGMSLDFWIFEVNVVGYVMLFGADGSFLRIVPEMLGFLVIGVLEYILVQKSLGNY